jgi:hypothetical protein
MPVYAERVLLADGRWMEAVVHADRRYRLCLWRNSALLIEYSGPDHRRRLRERAAAYEFRSVEQLRYDFERDVEATERQG